MYIVSQNDSTIINFSEGAVLKDGKYIVYRTEPAGPQIVLGSYESEDKAQDVFKQMINNCSILRAIFYMPES